MSEFSRGERMPLALGREADSDTLLLQNAVLASLGERERTAVRADGELIEFELRQSVYRPATDQRRRSTPPISRSTASSRS
jgi:hypothetical protein